MKPYEVGIFRTEYPHLWEYVLGLTKEEIEKDNLREYRQKAKGCDYDSLIKLVYYDPKAVCEPFVRDKYCKLVENVRSGKNKTHHYRQLRKFRRAELGQRPSAGRRNVIPAEPVLLTKQFLEIIFEIQKLHSDIDCNNAKNFKILVRDREFWDIVKKIKIDTFESTPPWSTASKDEIIDTVEKLLFDDLCKKHPTVIAREILAEKYGVEEETIRKKILPGIHEQVKLKYPDMPSDDYALQKIIDEAVSKQKKKKPF